MFGFGRINEMKGIQKKSEKYVKELERSLEDIKENLNETIEISHKSRKPENNIVNQKGILIKHIDEIQRLLAKYKGRVEVKDLEIAQEMAVEDLKIGVSEVEKMVYALKNMQIPTSENIQDYFNEYEDNFKYAVSGAGLAAGVGALAAGGVGVGTGLALTGMATGGLIGGSLVGVGSVLGGLGAIVSGPVGWVIGGLGLLGWLGSIPSKEEVADAREQLEEIQRKYEEVQNVYYETKKTRAKAEAVIRLSGNFTDTRVTLSNIFRLNIDLLEDLMEKDMMENRRRLNGEIILELNDELNRLVSALYLQYKDKKRFLYFFKRRKKIWELIENAGSIDEVLRLMKKYLRIPGKYKKHFEDISLLMKGSDMVQCDLSQIEVPEYFQMGNSYTLKAGELAEYKNELVEERVKITSPYVIKKLKEMIDFMKLMKNIIVTPMINVDTTSMVKVAGLDEMVADDGLEYAKERMDELMGLELSNASQLLLSNKNLTEDEREYCLEKYPQWCREDTDFDNAKERKSIFGKIIDHCRKGLEDVENLNLSSQDMEKIGAVGLRSEIERY